MALLQRRFRILPESPSGWISFAIFGLSLALLGFRIFLKPAIGLPISYLTIFLAASASGVVALYSVLLRRERALSVVTPLVIGMLAATWLLAESID